MSSLPTTSGPTLLTQWSVNWITLTVGIAALAWYLAMARRLAHQGQTWSPRRTAVFCLGIAAYLWCGNGFLNAYATTLMWTWSIQVLSLLLLIPVLLMGGQPIELAATTARRRSLLETAATSGPARILSHPVLSTALVPALTAVLFFGHVADLWTSRQWVAALLGIGLVITGCLIARQLTFEDVSLSSLAIGVMLAVSVLELLTDAIPGIVLRFSTHLVTDHFAVSRAPWAMSPLTDQKLSGSILWGVAEMLDLPFLLIVFLRWVRADEREGRRADQIAELPKHSDCDSESPAQAVGPSVGRAADGTRPVDSGIVGAAATQGAPADAPWWLDDPQLSSRPGLATRKGYLP